MYAANSFKRSCIGIRSHKILCVEWEIACMQCKIIDLPNKESPIHINCVLALNINDIFFRIMNCYQHQKLTVPQVLTTLRWPHTHLHGQRNWQFWRSTNVYLCGRQHTPHMWIAHSVRTVCVYVCTNEDEMKA